MPEPQNQNEFKCQLSTPPASPPASPSVGGFPEFYRDFLTCDTKQLEESYCKNPMEDRWKRMSAFLQDCESRWPLVSADQKTQETFAKAYFHDLFIFSFDYDNDARIPLGTDYKGQAIFLDLALVYIRPFIGPKQFGLNFDWDTLRHDMNFEGHNTESIIIIPIGFISAGKDGEDHTEWVAALASDKYLGLGLGVAMISF